MMHLGDYLSGTTIDFMWSSNAADGSSITRTTNGTISVYKANNLTQTTIGVTDTEDWDSLTGIHHVRIATTDAFYAVGNDYTVVLSGATIDGKTVNAVLALFSIENRNQKSDVTKWNGTAVATPDTAGHPKVTIKNGTGSGELSLSSGRALLQDASITSSTFAASAINATAIATDAITADKIANGAIDAGAIAADAITAAKIAADAVAEIQSGLATSADLAVVDSNVDSILADTGTDGVVIASGSKTGFSLASTGLDAVSVGEWTATGAEPTTFIGMFRMLWSRFYRRNEMTSSALKVYADNAAGGASGVLATQSLSDDGTTQIMTEATWQS